MLNTYWPYCAHLTLVSGTLGSYVNRVLAYRRMMKTPYKREAIPADHVATGDFPKERGRERGNVSEEKNDGLYTFPRVVLRDSLGRKLDTYTVLQEAIYRDKWNVKQTKEARNPNEWRLPKAPPPAKPDLSRRGPPAHQPIKSFRLNRLTGKENPPFRDRRFDDVSAFPTSFSLPKFLDSEEVNSERRYFQIVHGLYLEKRFLTQTVKLDSTYVFPGFCTGCRRAGFCYGCERSAFPHTHFDYQSRTGGGFTYWKHDKPLKEISRNHPKHWNRKDRTRMNDAGDDVTMETSKSITGDSIVEMYTVDGQDRLVLGDEQGSLLDEQTLRELLAIRIWEGIIDADGSHVLYQDESGMELAIHKNNLHQLLLLLPVSDPRRRDIMAVLDSGATSGKRLTSSVDSGSRRETLSPSSLIDRLSSSKDGASPIVDFIENLQKRRSLMEDFDEVGKSSSTKEESLYKAPKPFQLRQRERQQIVSESPFSSNREYHLRKSQGFKVKKSNKELTKFVAVNTGDSNWKPPKQFELKKFTKEEKEFQRKQRWEQQSRRRDKSNEDEDDTTYDNEIQDEIEHDNRFNRYLYSNHVGGALSPDSGLDSEFMTDSVKDCFYDEQKTDRLEITDSKSLEETQKGNGFHSSRTGVSDTEEWPPNQNLRIQNENQNESQTQVDGASGSDVATGDQGMTDGLQETTERRREIVKKTRKTDSGNRMNLSRASTKSLPSTEDEREMSFVFEDSPSPDTTSHDLLKLPTPVVTMTTPDLPTVEERKSAEIKQRQPPKYMVEPPPMMQQPPKQLKPPPKTRTLPKMKPTRRRRKMAEAPVRAESLRDVRDPLDFLAKYCIINPLRLPFYELIFESAVLENRPTYPVPFLPQVEDENEPDGQVTRPEFEPRSTLTDRERTLVQDLTLVGNGQLPALMGYTVPEQFLEKMNFIAETIETKMEKLQSKMMNLQEKKMSLLIELAKSEYPGIDNPNYSPRKKKAKKMNKKKPHIPENETAVTSETILERLTKKQMLKLSEDETIRQMDIQITRSKQKITDCVSRLQKLYDERNVLLEYCQDDYINRQFTERYSKDYRRQQSNLYNTLRPTPDYEINVENLRESLQQINNHLLTQKECDFLYHVLDLPRREKVNFHLFSVIAALSEKVTQLDPMIRSLINKQDFKALNIKMEKCKELFQFLEDDLNGQGEATASNLGVELTAGGLTPEHINYVLGKFNREGKGVIDFLDFVTYIPLFIEIHQRIIKDPLSNDQDL